MPKSNQPRIRFSRSEFLCLTAIPVNRFTTMNRRGQIPFVDALMPDEASKERDPDPNMLPFAYDFEFEMRRIDNKDAIAEDPRYLQHFPDEARKHRRYSADDAFAYIIADNLAREGGISRELSVNITRNAFGRLRFGEIDHIDDAWMGAVFFDLEGAEGAFWNAFALAWKDIPAFLERVAADDANIYRIVAVPVAQALKTLRVRAAQHGIDLPDELPEFNLIEAANNGQR